MGMGANQYNLLAQCVTTSEAGGRVSVAFGFLARDVRVRNTKATAVYVNLASMSASTGGHRTCSGELLVLSGVAIEGLGLASTTTSTGTVVEISAFGW